MPDHDPLTLSFEGPDALLLDGGQGVFSDRVQEKIWTLADALKTFAGMRETVPGMNNLMLVFDPLATDVEALEVEARRLWSSAGATRPPGAIHEVPVRYGGDDGPDLLAVAEAKQMSVGDLIARHATPLYSVAAVGAMPGFVYLSGLDPALSIPRLANPRGGVPRGSVIIGGGQAGIMPVTAPSGWHILGRTDLALFDPMRARPAHFRPGDRIRFVPEGRS